MIGLLYGAQKRSIYDIPTKAQQQESKNTYTVLFAVMSNIKNLKKWSKTKHFFVKNFKNPVYNCKQILNACCWSLTKFHKDQTKLHKLPG